MPRPAQGWGRCGVKVGILLVAFLGAAQPACAQLLQRDLPAIQKVIFSGNEFFSDKDLLKAMLVQFPSLLHPLRSQPRYQKNIFPKELRRIDAHYSRHGFGGAHATLDSVVAVADKDNVVRLHLSIREGVRTLLREVRYSPQQVFTLEDLHKATPIAPGDAYPFSAPQRGRLTRAIRLQFQSNGYLQVTVRDSTLISADSTEAVLIFRLDPGPQFRVRTVTVTGNNETKSELMQRELVFAEGEVYSYVRVQESRENLYATTLFRRVTIREENIDLAARTVDLHVAVLERKPAFIEGSVGLGRRDDFEARVVGRWGHRNLWGRGHLIDVQGTVAYNIKRGGDSFYLDGRIRYVDPHFMGTDTRVIPQVSRSIDRRIENVVLDESQVNLQALRKSGRFTTFGLGVSSQFTTTTLETATDDLLQTRAIQGWVSRNSSDNLFDPHSGDIRSVALQRAGFGGDNYFNRAAANYTRYSSFGPIVVAWGIRGGWVESYGPSRTEAAASIGIEGVPFEFLFQAGGNSTIRGFENNSLGSPVTVTEFIEGGDEAVVDSVDVNAGRILLIGNIEARFPLPWFHRWGMRGVAFVDAGNTWGSAPEMRNARWGFRYDQPYIGTADLRWSWGVGLRYPTIVGPIRLDLGVPIKRKTTPELHFGLGHTF